MIFNPSHKPTSGGLPPDLHEIYVRYKRNTRGLLNWFQQKSPIRVSFQDMTIKGLEAFVLKVAQKLTSLPDFVHFYFREVIGDRRRISKFYRTKVDEATDDAGTVGHEHFTDL